MSVQEPQKRGSASIAVDWSHGHDDMPPDYDVDEWRYAAVWIAARIRARGES